MPLYETVFIARQDISTQQVETLTEDMSKFITEGGGQVAKVENWGLRNLAYKVKKNRKGHYAFLKSDAPAADPADAPQPDVMEVAESGESGLVETPEAEAPAEKPKRKPRRRKPQPEAAPSEEPKAAE